MVNVIWGSVLFLKTFEMRAADFKIVEQRVEV
jgi:hypothetical protein